MRVLLDTGPWVAMIDRSEAGHTDCIKWLESFEGEIFSTEAVLTEVLYLLCFSRNAQAAALEFVLQGRRYAGPIKRGESRYRKASHAKVWRSPDGF